MGKMGDTLNRATLGKTAQVALSLFSAGSPSTHRIMLRTRRRAQLAAFNP